MVAALAAFFLRQLLVSGAGGFWVSLLDTILVAIFVLCLEGLVFGLLPITFWMGEYSHPGRSGYGWWCSRSFPSRSSILSWIRPSPDRCRYRYECHYDDRPGGCIPGVQYPFLVVLQAQIGESTETSLKGALIKRRLFADLLLWLNYPDWTAYPVPLHDFMQ